MYGETKIMITEKQLRMTTKLIGESAGNGKRIKYLIFKSDDIPSGSVKENGNEFCHCINKEKKLTVILNRGG
jgi:hypothetical protein